MWWGVCFRTGALANHNSHYSPPSLPTARGQGKSGKAGKSGGKKGKKSRGLHVSPGRARVGKLSWQQVVWVAERELEQQQQQRAEKDQARQRALEARRAAAAAPYKESMRARLAADLNKHMVRVRGYVQPQSAPSFKHHQLLQMVHSGTHTAPGTRRRRPASAQPPARGGVPMPRVASEGRLQQQQQQQHRRQQRGQLMGQGRRRPGTAGPASSSLLRRSAVTAAAR